MVRTMVSLLRVSLLYMRLDSKERGIGVIVLERIVERTRNSVHGREEQDEGYEQPNGNIWLCESIVILSTGRTVAVC
jgi:hypothetical protein